MRHRWTAHPPSPSGVPARETTLGGGFSRQGRGLHTGRRCGVTVAPAPAGHGIRFRDAATPSSARDVAATGAAWIASRMCTALDLGGGRRLRTIEHLMASLSASGVDNALVTVDGPEIPILDGSARPWCEAIDAVGLRSLDAPRLALRLREPFQVNGLHGFLRAEPSDRFEIDVSTDRLPGLGVMRWAGPVDAATFRREIAPSRSFGNPALLWRTLLTLPLARAVLPGELRERWWHRAFDSQTVRDRPGREPNRPDPACERAVSADTLARLAPQGREPLLRGARPGRVAIVAGERILGGARFADEPVRHKALDLIGDLALAGRPILGRFVANCPTHVLTHAFLTELMRHPQGWEVVATTGDRRPPPPANHRNPQLDLAAKRSDRDPAGSRAAPRQDGRRPLPALLPS